MRAQCGEGFGGGRGLRLDGGAERDTAARLEADLEQARRIEILDAVEPAFGLLAMEEIPVHVGRFTECPVIRGDGERRVAVRGIDAAALRDRDDAKALPAATLPVIVAGRAQWPQLQRYRRIAAREGVLDVGGVVSARHEHAPYQEHGT